MGDEVSTVSALVTEAIGDRAGAWDDAGELPLDVLRMLGARGVLCAEVAREYGGLGMSGVDNGTVTAHIGELCGSVRSVATSQGMAAWTITRFGSAGQKAAFLPRLTGGELAGVAFSEPGAGSDLSAMTTEIHCDGDTVVVSGNKVWVTVGHYADLLVVFGRYRGGASAVVVAADAPGVTVTRVRDPLGCRAAGHAQVRLEQVRLPAGHLLKGAPLVLLVTTALTYGRLSVAWGCAGILRACQKAAVAHARSRKQFGGPLAGYQLVQRHLAELLTAEQVATRMCEHASRCWDENKPEMVTAAVLAKYVAAGNAVRGAASAVQVLASAGATHGHVVARAYRDAKLMEIIEGSTEICQLLLADHALAVTP